MICTARTGQPGGSAMIQCEACEHFVRGPDGQVAFRCNPFGTIKEPECLIKWQLLRLTELGQKLDRMVAAYEATVEMYRKMQPLQEKMFRQMERELDDVEEADAWKYTEDDEDEVDAADDEQTGGFGT